MVRAKSVFVSMAVLGLSLSFHPGQASAGVFSSLVSNPFVFCSAPKPCKQCHPFRKIWEKICKDQQGASKMEAPPPGPFKGTELQMRQEIERLTQMHESQNTMSAAAGKFLEQCVALKGSVQLCADEKEDYDGALNGANDTLNEIGRLQTAIDDCELNNGGKPNRTCAGNVAAPTQ